MLIRGILGTQTHVLTFTLQSVLELFISIDTDKEYLLGTTGRSTIKREIKTESKSHPGKKERISYLFKVYLFHLEFKFESMCYYYMIKRLC